MISLHTMVAASSVGLLSWKGARLLQAGALGQMGAAGLGLRAALWVRQR